MLNDQDKQQLLTVVEQVLDFAKSAGATSADVAASMGTGFSVEARLGDVETIEHNYDKGVSITLYRDKASGSVSTSDVSKEALLKAVQSAMNIAHYTAEDPYSGLADEDLMATEFPDLAVYHPWGLTPQQAIEKTIECESIAREHDKRITNSDGVTLSTHEELVVYANSYGFIGVQKDTRHYLSCVMVAEKLDEMQRDYAYTIDCDPQKLTSIKSIAQQAAERTIARLGSKSVATQKIPVLFNTETARSLLGSFLSAINGGALHRKASFLVDHLGKPIFPSWLNLEEQPYLKGYINSTAFDDEGVQTRQKYLVENGILKSYMLDSYSARKLGMKTTANAGGVFNLQVSSGDKDFAGLIKQMDTGLIVTEVMGQGINITTGDYSRGASGFWVEKGEILFPVNEVTIAGNLKDIFANIVAIGHDVDRRGSIHTGSILIEQMMLAGV